MSTPVTLYVYDLSNGLAKVFSPLLLGRDKRIEGVWHTAIVVYGNEYFFGGQGIASCPPGTTLMGPPQKQDLLGVTSITQDVFEEYLIGTSTSKFHGSSYHLLEHNCNNFSDEVAKFLVGKGIDENILSVPQKVISSPLGPMLKSHMEKMSNVAPTDSRRLTREARSEIAGTSGRGERGYFPCFCPVSLSTTEIDVLKKVDTSLWAAVEHGPLSTSDLPLLSLLHAADKLVFVRVVALLTLKPGFTRMLFEKADLLSLTKRELVGLADSSGEVMEALQTLANNLIAGMNQIERRDRELVDVILTHVASAISEGESIVNSRTLYNLCGSSLTEDQILELSGSLIHHLPDSPPDKQTNGHTKEQTHRNREDLRLRLQALYLLIVKSRQVGELATCMGKDVRVFRKVKGLEGVVELIVDIQRV